MQRTPPQALTTTVLAFCVATSFLYGQQARRPPGEPRGSIVDYDAPPPTLRGLFDVVAVAYGPSGGFLVMDKEVSIPQGRCCKHLLAVCRNRNTLDLGVDSAKVHTGVAQPRR